MSRNCPTKTASDLQYAAHTGVPYSTQVQARAGCEEIVRQVNAMMRSSKGFIVDLAIRDRLNAVGRKLFLP
jgi:hypothetical protein